MRQIVRSRFSFTPLSKKEPFFKMAGNPEFLFCTVMPLYTYYFTIFKAITSTF